MEYLKSGNIFEFVAINERANGGHGRLVRQVDRVPTGSDGAFQSPPQMKHFARIRKGRFQNVAIGNTRNYTSTTTTGVLLLLLQMLDLLLVVMVLMKLLLLIHSVG